MSLDKNFGVLKFIGFCEDCQRDVVRPFPPTTEWRNTEEVRVSCKKCGSVVMCDSKK